MKCIACGSHAIVPGHVGKPSGEHRFEPCGLDPFMHHQSIALKPPLVHACMHCGHVGGECDPAGLRALIDASGQSHLLDDLRCRAGAGASNRADEHVFGAVVECPACRDPVNVVGRIAANYPRKFWPEGLRGDATARSILLDAIDIARVLRACTACGHVWGAVDPSALRSLVQKSAADALRTRLQQLGALPRAMP